MSRTKVVITKIDDRPNGLTNVKPGVGDKTANPVIDGCLINRFPRSTAETRFAITSEVFIYSYLYR